ncbi:lasso RiPP family leader peptide-containing protein [Amycolatopsis minnesotensis]|uniref:Lasso RiPP family leader peptide-containing protein n=1 Tax=Amycolatopsis minnesotensis TaxID=337894 RepID=A0ABN2R566_9PSEU
MDEQHEPRTLEVPYEPPALVELGAFTKDTLGNGYWSHDSLGFQGEF